ncbi:WYL domain-containing protein [Alteromonadales bacterium alter-6D02]|nr:WYL domain-containing protein [Alteromonadales bacterium alter-6D02]
MNYAQRERLAYIDFCLEYHGQIGRADLIQRFKTGLASCSRDLSLYRELAPNNAVLTHETKKYLRSNNFLPIFNHDPDSVLQALSRGFGDGISQEVETSNICFNAIGLINPQPEIVGALMRAIHGGSTISCKYESLTSGATQRTLIPHAIVNNGHRWHVRAYDRKTKSFRDFVCTRFSKVDLVENKMKETELAKSDDEWDKILELKIVVHPSIKHNRAIEMDYGMTNGVLKLEVRAALVGYLLRQWNVDCSEHASISGAEYQLYLQNKQTLLGTKNLTIAPRYHE